MHGPKNVVVLSAASSIIPSLSLLKQSGNVNNNGIKQHGQQQQQLCRVPSQSESDRLRAIVLGKQQRRTTTILAAVVLFFGLAWLPHNLLSMVIEYDMQLLQWHGTNYLYILSMASHR